MNSKRQSYQERAEMLAKAVDIAESVIKESSTLSEDVKSHMLQWEQQVKQMALNPKKQFKRVASIKYLENDFLTYWNEATGPDVEEFWSMVARSGIVYKRKDVLGAILKRGKIKDIHEYEYLTDSLVVEQQTGRINRDQANELSRFLEEFERRNKDKG